VGTKIWIFLTGLGAAIAVSFLVGRTVGVGTVQSEWDTERIAAVEAMNRAEKETRQVEQEWGRSTIATVDLLNERLEETRNELETSIAFAESGAARLRDDLSGCKRQLSAAAASVPADDEAREAGLSAARQRVALQIGADADKVVALLESCQNYVRAITPQ